MSEQETPKRGGGRKWLLGCGIALVVIIIIVVAVYFVVLKPAVDLVQAQIVLTLECTAGPTCETWINETVNSHRQDVLDCYHEGGSSIMTCLEGRGIEGP